MVGVVGVVGWGVARRGDMVFGSRASAPLHSFHANGTVQSKASQTGGEGRGVEWRGRGGPHAISLSVQGTQSMEGMLISVGILLFLFNFKCLILYTVTVMTSHFQAR